MLPTFRDDFVFPRKERIMMPTLWTKENKERQKTKTQLSQFVNDYLFTSFRHVHTSPIRFTTPANNAFTASAHT